MEPRCIYVNGHVCIRVSNLPFQIILLREEGEQKVPECTFEVNEVYAVDVAMTTGEGKPREMTSGPLCSNAMWTRRIT